MRLMNTSSTSEQFPGRLLPGSADDSGYVMLMAMFAIIIGVGAVMLIFSSALFTVRQTTLGRERVQSTATAEAGLDSAFAALEQSNGTNVPCSLSGAATGVAQDPGYQVQIEYFTENPSRDGEGDAIPLTCTPGSGVSEVPYQAVVTSTGSTAVPGVPGAASKTRRMEALVRLRANAATWADRFTKAVFSEASITTTNQWALNGAGADFYTNGNFACNSSSRVDGSVYTQGTANLTNACRVLGDVWARGQITTSTTTVNIGGSVKSSTAGLRIGNNPLTIGGNVLLATTLVNSDGNSPNVGGTISQNLGTFADPPKDTFPKIGYDATNWTDSGWQIMTWVNYISGLRADGPAPGWWTSTSYCTIAYQSYSLNEPMLSPNVPTVLDARTCSSNGGTNLQWQGNSKAVELKLRADLTIIATDFYNTGTLKVTSVDAAGNPSTTPRQLRIIVPWVNGSSCGASGAGKIKFDAGGVQFDPTITVLLYTPGTITLSNGVTLSGQIYGCTVTASNATTVNFVPVGGPTEDDAAASSTYALDIVYQRDARG